jgi:hypothetical protein
LSFSPVMISLALTPSGICNPLKKCNLELEARVGIGLIFPPLHLKYCLILLGIQAKTP